MIAMREIPTGSVLRRALHRNRLLACVVMVHYLLALVVSSILGQRFEVDLTTSLTSLFKLMLPIFLVAFTFWRFAIMVIHVRPSRPIQWYIDDMRRVLLDADRLLAGLVAMLLFLLTVQAFMFFKSIVPYDKASWDPALAALDRAIHGGYDPFVLLTPILRHPYVVTFVNGCYHFWFFLIYLILHIACFSKTSHDRDTFLVAFVLTWILGGNVLAIALASGGPVYFEALGHGDTFSPLMAALSESNESSPVWALKVQAALWEGHTGARPEVGISAMPSMHVASSVVLALYGFRLSRWAGLLLGLFAAIILIGSVLLGWHYAVDGYVGALVAVGCWALAARLVRPQAAESPSPAGAKGLLWAGRRPGLYLPPGE